MADKAVKCFLALLRDITSFNLGGVVACACGVVQVSVKLALKLGLALNS